MVRDFRRLQPRRVARKLAVEELPVQTLKYLLQIVPTAAGRTQAFRATFPPRSVDAAGERRALKRKPDSIRAPREKRAADRPCTARSQPALLEPGAGHPATHRKCKLPSGRCANEWCCANLRMDGIQPAGSAEGRRAEPPENPSEDLAVMTWPRASASVQRHAMLGLMGTDRVFRILSVFVVIGRAGPVCAPSSEVSPLLWCASSLPLSASFSDCASAFLGLQFAKHLHLIAQSFCGAVQRVRQVVFGVTEGLGVIGGIGIRRLLDSPQLDQVVWGPSRGPSGVLCACRPGGRTDPGSSSSIRR